MWMPMAAEPGTQAIDRAAELLVRVVEAATPLGVGHLAQEDSRHFVGGTNWVGRRVPYETAANGKVLKAFATHEPSDIRARGYAIAIDELEHGLSALAAPVLGPDGVA